MDPKGYSYELTSATDVDENHKDPSSVEKVTVAAPSDLPAGYRLPIRYKKGGTILNGFCRIPEGGVYRGQEFEADIIPPRPVVGRWAQDVFGCDSRSMNSAFCWLSLCCTPVAWACLYESAMKQSRGSCWPIMLVLTAIINLLAFRDQYQAISARTQGYEPSLDGDMIYKQIRMALGIMVVIILVYVRSSIRGKFSIPGNTCGDCICVYFCGCCTGTFSML